MNVLQVILILILLGVVAFFAKISFWRLSEYERLAVFSITGKFKGMRGPGLVFVNPFSEIPWREKIDLREREIRRERMHCITKDSVPIDIMPIVFFRIVLPEKTVLTVADAEGSILDLTKTTLRAVVGEMELSEVVAQRERIVQELKKRLSAEADRWGVEITTVEIAELRPRGRVSEAMVERKTMIEDAEAKKRAMILKAQGERESAKAEAESMLIRAEAEKKAMILRAEGERDALILRGEGLSAYYRKLAELGEAAELALRYENVEVLKKFASTETPKLVMLPLEFHTSFTSATAAKAGSRGEATTEEGGRRERRHESEYEAKKAEEEKSGGGAGGVK